MSIVRLGQKWDQWDLNPQGRNARLILSQLRLPISPWSHGLIYYTQHQHENRIMEHRFSMETLPDMNS